MLEYLAAAIAGVATGAFTGLVPGFHANTVVFTSFPLYFRLSPGLMVYMSFISALSVSHTFHDFLPAIFLGVAEAEAALATLPGPSMAAAGRGLEAFYLALRGSLASVSVFVAVAPLMVLLLEPVYSLFSDFMFYLIVFFAAYAVFSTDRIIASAAVASLSAALGLLVFDAPVNQSYVLMPVFGGLFALPSVIRGLDGELELPEQKEPEDVSYDRSGVHAGVLAGLLSGMMPGLGSATSTSFLSPLMGKRKSFMVSMGAVNTSDIFVSFMALLLVGKSRSGASVAFSYISDPGSPQMVFLIGISALAASMSFPLAFVISGRFSEFLQTISVSWFYAAAGAAVVAATLWLTGFIGVLILLTAGSIGYAAAEAGERKSCMMVLMVPALQFYGNGLIV
ncbi:MAG: tripartite tricarboxylate transporter permease [Candidatus Nanohaloarchaea archaeon]